MHVLFHQQQGCGYPSVTLGRVVPTRHTTGVFFDLEVYAFDAAGGRKTFCEGFAHSQFVKG